VDEELKTYLRQMEERNVALIAGVGERIAGVGERIAGVEERIAGVEERIASVEKRNTALIAGVEERTAALIAAEVGSLHTDIQNVEKRLSTRFDSIDSRMKLQAGLIQAGARAMARFSEFAENSEERWVELAARVETVEREIADGKHRNGNGKN
jgi:chromosome segregation ATPase